MGRLFGTDGIRGIANKELGPSLAYNLGKASTYLFSNKGKKKVKIGIGMDPRISSGMLEAALTAGICSAGGEAAIFGVVPTPAVAYLTRYYEFDAGIVISASHNSFEYNGIKIFDNKGYKLSEEQEDEIQRIIETEVKSLPKATGGDIGKRVEIDNAVHTYLGFLKKTVDVDLRGMKIAIDCANGSSFVAAPSILADLGARIDVINNKPNGININQNCGSTHLEGLKKLMLEKGSHIGLAFDGDADRLIAIDNEGKEIHGDYIMAICAKYMKTEDKLKNDTVVSTIMSNMGLEIALKRNQCSMIRTKVGDKYVLKEMIEGGYNFGGEQSGHIIFLDHNTTGDGLLTALQLLYVMKKTGCKLSELSSSMIEYPQILLNAKVNNTDKGKVLENPDVKEAIESIEKQLESKGRLVIRPSGTEPLIRVMIEGKDKSKIQAYAESLVALIEQKA